MKRRDFLSASAAASTVAMWPGRARASWGDAPAANAGSLLPPGVRAEKCLELYLYGGIPSFHSFYAIPEYGQPTDPNPALQNTQYYQFEADKQAVWGAQCGAGPTSSWLTPFGADALGMTVHLTPMVAPLVNRPDILARMRVVVTRHELGPHEIAIPYMLTGSRLGNPRMAGLGTHIQRHASNTTPPAGWFPSRSCSPPPARTSPTT